MKSMEKEGKGEISLLSVEVVMETQLKSSNSYL